LRFIHGDGDRGFEFWPLFGHRGRAHDYDEQFYLWPLFYKSTKIFGAATRRQTGALPFYTRDTRPGFISETMAGPFSVTPPDDPVKYDEKRYFWPFLVQGRGDVRYVNRWGPVYYPLHHQRLRQDLVCLAALRHAQWADQGIAQERIRCSGFCIGR